MATVNKALRTFLRSSALITSLLVGLTESHAAPVDTLKLLQDSDRSRGGMLKGISWDIEIESTEDGEKSSRAFRVKAKGVDAYVEATAPARNKDEVFLFNDRTIWFFRPGLRKPVSISSRQKLSGQAANGDIASTNYSKDYEGTLSGEESLKGEPTYVLELKAKSKSQTYDQIKYWISKKSRLGIQAAFKTVSGEPFKRATFEYSNQIVSGGEKIPFVSKMFIQDAKFPENKSTITYKSPKEIELSSSIFNVNNLVR